MLTRRAWLAQLLPSSPSVQVIEGGGAAGGPALYMNNGDLIGVRNIQGGTSDGRGLDIAAGNAKQRARTAINFDLGKSLDVYDGHGKLLARFDRRGITFYVRPRIRK
jgi:hypothetical protein